MDTQSDFAEEIADELRQNAHDVYALDILDALASCGLTLAKDEAGQASAHYYNQIRKQLA